VEPDWPTCDVESCPGVQVQKFGACLTHLRNEQLDKFLDRLQPGSDIDARGTTITESLLARLLDAVSDEDGLPIFGLARFECGKFSGPANFDRSTFLKDACFADTEFCGAVSFFGVKAREEAIFIGARFTHGAYFGAFSAAVLALDGALLVRRVAITGTVDIVSCHSTCFEDGVTLRLGASSVSATQATFGAASSIVGEGEEPTRLLSLRETDVSNLELIDVDLRWCRFSGAHRLDQLRITGRCEFSRPPASWWWTRRQIIAEEAAWRGWPPAARAGEMVPERVVTVYRSLRKALEDSKNEAGAGDFYYGEMDARRHSRETRPAERWILWFYWLLAGYGQRAGRALIALLVLIATVATMLTIWGQPAENAARIAVGAVVFRDDRTELTTAGEWTVLVARFLGPVLLALAVLAVRARVKR
jgi:hypothetical protein